MLGNERVIRTVLVFGGFEYISDESCSVYHGLRKRSVVYPACRLKNSVYQPIFTLRVAWMPLSIRCNGLRRMMKLEINSYAGIIAAIVNV